jgi:triphosphoribosyl-dephospho-CoA synthase
MHTTTSVPALLRAPQARQPQLHRAAPHRYSHAVARLAVRGLHAELALYPKPGLVSLIDTGSHTDMDAGTFMHSMFSLRHYFRRICQAGMDDAPFAELKQLGIAAEQRMLGATGGINTHRGAIFCVGLLCATLGRAWRQRTPLSADALRALLRQRWGAELGAHAGTAAGASNGLQVAARYAVGGAREEAALGLPSVFEIGLPALQATLAAGRGMQLARIDALFALMAHISDTNTFHRGGAAGAETVRREARSFLAAGGTANPGWRARALASHRLFIAHNLSPGGAADLLAATCLVQAALSR